MDGGERGPERTGMADLALGRERMYGLLAGVFGGLPDKTLVTALRGSELDGLLEIFCEIGDAESRSGADRIRSYRDGIGSRSDAEIFNELAVDRTRILRPAGHADLKAPYEGAYEGAYKGNAQTIALKVKEFYRRTGLLPDETIPESPDYLGIELDFMRQLCRREYEQWSASADVNQTVADEERFIREHLGRWTGEYVARAKKCARTDFYQGFLMILAAFVALDRESLPHDPGTGAAGCGRRACCLRDN